MKLDMEKFNRRKAAVWRRLRKNHSETEKTSFYTDDELEALSEEPENHSGVMRLHTAELHLPKSLEEPTSEKQKDSGIYVMLVIILLMLIFIGIIAYFVSQMPDKS
jgi:hypothetical protein